MNLRFVFCLIAAFAFGPGAFAQDLPPHYERRAEHDPNGTGLFFMGREIAHVCQGGDWLERSDRELEENVELMVELLQLKPGDVVADIGAGTGYVSRKLAKRVAGNGGVVYATEIQKEMLVTLTNKAFEAGITNILPVLGTVTDPNLPEASIDLALMVDVYHEFDRPYEMVQNISKAMKPGGRIVFVEYRAEDPKVPIKAVHKMSLEQVKKEMAVHPLIFEQNIDKLPWQHLVIFRKGMPAVGETPASAAAQLPTQEEVFKSKRDLWGEAAMQQPNGPSYEFFEKLLPPPRYVNADFHFYPIVLSAPNAKTKARLISNGSGVNLKAGGRQWKDNGTPAIFRVGPDELGFGRFPERLQGEPELAEGYLPIVTLRYMHQSPIGAEGMVPVTQTRVERLSEVYQLEAFASVDPILAEHGVVFVKFSLPQGTSGTITLEMDSKSDLKVENGKIIDDQGRTLAYLDKNWKKALDNSGKWRPPFVQAKLATNSVATLAIPTRPLGDNVKFAFDNATFAAQRKQCVETWKTILGQGMSVETPEPIVNNAWRHLLIQNFELINGNVMRYSAGNQYDALYEAEGSDAALAMMVWGFEKDTKRLLMPLFDFSRKGLEFHQAGFKLNNICRYYWQTRDASIWEEMRSRWEKEAERLDKNRTGAHGLYPEEQYCGDIHTRVQSLNVNSKGWRAMRDLSAALDEIGEKEKADHFAREAGAFRQTVLTAIEKSVNRSTTPPFVPIALFTNEPVHSPICDVRIGSYWNIIIGYAISSGIFPAGSEGENWIPNYQEQHGGLCMGMVRSGGMSNTWWNTEYKLNPLYGTRYALDALRRDDVGRALVSFYGMLAQGFTRNTFVCGEGAALVPLDAKGRLFSLPPNSAANAHFLSMLRYMLVQDMDNDDDGKPETLRLGFATPQRWLEDGKGYSVERAPTAFGPVSVKVASHLSKGEIVAEVELPARNQPKQTLLRMRAPDGWKITSAQAGNEKLQADAKGTVDLFSLRGKQTIRFSVEKK